jgi:peptide-methionine (S)-S-oxide reductase
MSNEKSAVAVFGGGCFWCTEAVFDELGGVRSVVSGYAGGAVKNPTYEQVCMGNTGHAEVIKIEFDPAEISFRDLMTVFFATHDRRHSIARATMSAPSIGRRFSTRMTHRRKRPLRS